MTAPRNLWVGMTVAAHTTITGWTHDVAAMIGLTDWLVLVSDEPCDPDEAMAEVVITPGRRVAVVKLSRIFCTYDQTEQAHTILHELLHIHFYPLRATLVDALPPLIGAAAASIIECYQSDAEEVAVDNLATAMLPMVPTFPKVGV